MVGLHDRLRRKDEEVVAKIMDGEAIIINLATGVYYSLDNSGAAIWEMIDEGWRLDEIAAALASRYDVGAAQAERDVLRLATELLREEIVAVAEGNGTAPRAGTPAASQPLAYVSPSLNAYRDMADLLALDPPSPSLSTIPWKA